MKNKYSRCIDGRQTTRGSMPRIESVLDINSRFTYQIVGTDHVIIVNTDCHHVVHRYYRFEIENSKQGERTDKRLASSKDQLIFTTSNCLFQIDIHNKKV